MRSLLRSNLWRRNRAVLGLTVLAVLGLLLLPACTSSSGNAQQAAEVGVNVGNLAPDFSLTDLEGEQVSLSALRGKTVMVNFWATWCPPCRAEMPEIEATYREYHDKGLAVIGVDVLEPEGVVRQFVQQGGFSWSFVIDSTGAVAKRYQVNALPTSFFIDRDGIIQAVIMGAMSRDDLEGTLDEIMK